MHEPPIRVLIADDHAVVRRGLRGILVESFPRGAIGEADATEAMRQLRQQEWGVVILDLALGDRSGLDVLISPGSSAFARAGRRRCWAATGVSR